MRLPLDICPVPLLLMPVSHALTNFRGQRSMCDKKNPREWDEKTKEHGYFHVHGHMPTHTVAAYRDVPGINIPNPGGHSHCHPCLQLRKRRPCKIRELTQTCTERASNAQGWDPRHLGPEHTLSASVPHCPLNNSHD